MWGARGRRLRRRGPLRIGGEPRASSAAGLGSGAPGTGGRHHGQASETGRGQRPFRLFPGQGSQAQGAVRGAACGPWGFGPWGPDVGPWTLRSGVEQLQGAGAWREDGRVREAFGPRLGKGQVEGWRCECGSDPYRGEEQEMFGIEPLGKRGPCSRFGKIALPGMTLQNKTACLHSIKGTSPLLSKRNWCVDSLPLMNSKLRCKQ